jgi:predicted nucleic acid-binding protein
LKWLLDTNVVSETVRRRPTDRVIRWLSQIALDDAAVSIVTMAELAAGIERAPTQDSREQLRQWISNWAEGRLVHQPLPLAHDILVEWLHLSRNLAARGIARSAPDLLIAATARMHRLAVVTRNVRDFADTGLVVYDPWSDQTHHMDLP